MGPALDSGSGLHGSTTANVGAKDTAGRTPNVTERIAKRTRNAHNVVNRLPHGHFAEGHSTALSHGSNSRAGARRLHEPKTALSPHGRKGSPNRMLRWAKTRTPKSMRVCAKMHPTTTRFNIAPTDFHPPWGPHRMQAAACTNPRLPTSDTRARLNARRMLPTHCQTHVQRT